MKLPIKERICRKCEFFRVKMYCRRRAPAKANEQGLALWPIVDEYAQCGDWELAECIKRGCNRKQLTGYDDIFCRKHKNG